jgi:HD superfamily phosphohydrolase YqeK
MRATFIKAIDTIKNEELREFAHFCIDNIPAYFWNIPASSSGKYHPVTDLGEGGLVRHSLMVYRIALDLLTQNNITDATFCDMVKFAALFHDCCKAGVHNDPAPNTVHEHPTLAVILLSEIADSFQPTETFEVILAKICNAIESHMGRWTTSKYSSIELPIPETELAMLVHTADYIASRKYCLYDEEFFNNL